MKREIEVCDICGGPSWYLSKEYNNTEMNGGYPISVVPVVSVMPSGTTRRTEGCLCKKHWREMATLILRRTEDDNQTQHV